MDVSGPPVEHAISVGMVALFCGVSSGVSAKSVALSSVSSRASSRVGQPGVIVRVIELAVVPAAGMPPGSTGVPTGPGSAAAPVKLPQATQSGGLESGRHTAPPDGAIRVPTLAAKSRLVTSMSPSRMRRWLSPAGTLAVIGTVAVTAPAAL